MSNAVNLGAETGAWLASIPAADPAPRGFRHPRDAWLRIGSGTCDAQESPSQALRADARL
jgi:hypothetical protein